MPPASVNRLDLPESQSPHAMAKPTFTLYQGQCPRARYCAIKTLMGIAAHHLRKANPTNDITSGTSDNRLISGQPQKRALGIFLSGKAVRICAVAPLYLGLSHDQAGVAMSSLGWMPESGSQPPALGMFLSGLFTLSRRGMPNLHHPIPRHCYV